MGLPFKYIRIKECGACTINLLTAHCIFYLDVWYLQVLNWAGQYIFLLIFAAVCVY
ncbi:hypothetical protein MKX03_012979 [Papaver bracteatum]|nr:hypothetical protein MKX03_012979 [Papaver bracteatum]